MKLVIKKDIFISLFGVIKTCSSSIHCTFETDYLHIQGMDKSHVCLFNVKLFHEMFVEYNVNQKTQICFDSATFYSIISTKSDNQHLIISMNDADEDNLYINFTTIVEPEGKKGKKSSKTDIKKFFKIPLSEYNFTELVIPEREYDVEFSISSKEIADILSQLNNFGDDIFITCNQEELKLTATGVSGEMRVDISADDLISYAIIEDADFTLAYSLIYLNKLCITNKLSQNIDFSLSGEYPMMIRYVLGESSMAEFFIACKMLE